MGRKRRNYPKNRKKPVKHTVKTKHNRYNVNQYPRGSRLVTREGVTKTAHAWRIDDSLKAEPVYGEATDEWRRDHNRSDVVDVDYPSPRSIDFPFEIQEPDEPPPSRVVFTSPYETEFQKVQVKTEGGQPAFIGVPKKRIPKSEQKYYEVVFTKMRNERNWKMPTRRAIVSSRTEADIFARSLQFYKGAKGITIT
jgi:hypothetical protein